VREDRNPREKQIARALLVGVCVFVLASFILNVRAFLVENDGIEFYVKRPWLILACLLFGVTCGLVVHVIQRVIARKQQG
jgi:hypothetical protein